MSKTTLTHQASHNTAIASDDSMLNEVSNPVKGFFTAIGNGVNSIYNGITYSTWSVFVKPFLPTHRVVFSLYTVIPGLPVKRNETVHAFEKGTTKKAIKFYNDVIRSTTEKKIVPAEVRLYKRKKVVASRNFGPVNEIKKFKIVNKRVKV